MDANGAWLKFVLSGKPKDYINYVNLTRNPAKDGVDNIYFRGRLGGRGDEYRRKGQADNTYDP